MSFHQLYEYLVSDIDYEPIISFLESHLDKKRLTLDAGCGTGVCLVPLIQKGYLVEGIDLDSNMLAITNEKLHQANLYAPLYEHDLKKPLNHTYDQIILMNDVINYFKGVKTIFKQLKQALTPNGFILFDCYKYEYLDVMDGYIEQENEPIYYEWQVSVKNESMTHTIKSDETYIIRQIIKPLQYYIDTLNSLGMTAEVIHGPDDRKHYIKTSL